jgi:hypothetical protein
MTNRAGRAAAIDALLVIVFVATGRSSHSEGLTPGGIASVAAPFLIAGALGWTIGRTWRDPLAARSGVVVWLSTVAAGMVLRHFVFARGTATAFVVVATVVLGIALNGWRALARVRMRTAA